MIFRQSSEAWYSSRMNAEHFSNDRAYSSKELSFYICHVNVLFVMYIIINKYIFSTMIGYGMLRLLLRAIW